MSFLLSFNFTWLEQSHFDSQTLLAATLFSPPFLTNHWDFKAVITRKASCRFVQRETQFYFFVWICTSFLILFSFTAWARVFGLQRCVRRGVQTKSLNVFSYFPCRWHLRRTFIARFDIRSLLYSGAQKEFRLYSGVSKGKMRFWYDLLLGNSQIWAQKYARNVTVRLALYKFVQNFVFLTS